MLAGESEAGELLELRYRREDGHRMGQLFESPRRLRRLASRAIRLGRRTDVYVGCAPRIRRHGGRDAVARTCVLWADCDGEHAVDALERFEPQPSIVIASSSARNCHACWPLTRPLAAAEIERANRRLAHALGADPASADAARILRVPSTYSYRHQPPAPVDALRLDIDRRMPAADVVGGLADPPHCSGRCRRGGTLRPRRAAVRLPAARRGLPAPAHRAASPLRPPGHVMGEQLDAVDFIYVDSDVPPGMTIAEWRARQSRARRPDGGGFVACDGACDPSKPERTLAATAPNRFAHSPPECLAAAIEAVARRSTQRSFSRSQQRLGPEVEAPAGC